MVSQAYLNKLKAGQERRERNRLAAIARRNARKIAAWQPESRFRVERAYVNGPRFFYQKKPQMSMRAARNRLNALRIRAARAAFYARKKRTYLNVYRR